MSEIGMSNLNSDEYTVGIILELFSNLRCHGAQMTSLSYLSEIVKFNDTADLFYTSFFPYINCNTIGFKIRLGHLDDNYIGGMMRLIEGCINVADLNEIEAIRQRSCSKDNDELILLGYGLRKFGSIKTPHAPNLKDNENYFTCEETITRIANELIPIHIRTDSDLHYFLRDVIFCHKDEYVARCLDQFTKLLDHCIVYDQTHVIVSSLGVYQSNILPPMIPKRVHPYALLRLFSQFILNVFYHVVKRCRRLVGRRSIPSGKLSKSIYLVPADLADLDQVQGDDVIHIINRMNDASAFDQYINKDVAALIESMSFDNIPDLIPSLNNTPLCDPEQPKNSGEING